MKKRFIAIMLIIALLSSLLSIFVACEPEDDSPQYVALSGLDTSKQVTLNIAIPYESDKGLNEVANAFRERYPNVNVVLTYLQNYNASAKTRILNNTIDIILSRDARYEENYTTVDEVAKSTDDYLYNFAADTEINFSYTTDDVMSNYLFTKDNNEECMYSVPMGGELRGLFVNVTLLKQYNLEIPTNFEQFMACCATLKSQGIIPIQGNPSTMGRNIVFGELVNCLMNDATAKAALQNADADIGQYCEDVLKKLYDFTAAGYYEYKTIENEIGNGMASEDMAARQFLGLVNDASTSTWATLSETDENYKYTQCAFWPYLNSSSGYVQSLIDDYDLDIEFKFILAPLNDADENSKAYFAPYYGLVANKNSADLLWIREFVNFFFFAENNKLYASTNGIIPNTTDAMDYLSDLYGINKDTDVTLCGEILFREDYNAATVLASAVETFTKTNPPKYMVVLVKDANGDIVYYNDDDGKGDYLFLANDAGNPTGTKVYKADISDIEYKEGYALRSFSYCLRTFNSAFSRYRLADE